MAAAKQIKTVAGTTPAATATGSSLNPVTPLNDATILAAITQLQNSVNELVVRYNAHADAAHSGANKVTGAAQTAANLFTSN